MADPGLSTPVPEDEDDEALFGPGGAQDGQQPPTQSPGASASAGGPATVVGLDPTPADDGPDDAESANDDAESATDISSSGGKDGGRREKET